MTAAPLLLIEDTSSLRIVYESVLRAAGHVVHSASDAETGLRMFRQLRPAAVVLDLMLPDRDGLDLMREFLDLAPGTPVIIVTADGSINRAVAAMRAGAHEFLVKPFDEQRFLNAIDNAIGSGRPGPAPTAVRGVSDRPPGDFLGDSAPMRQVYDRIRSVARSMATVFITGESGTGKELCAMAVHDLSARAQGPFVPLNCAAIPSELLESEVFGHLKGSFTGAISDKLGAAAAADGGTLFLDEICELDLNLQTKLLRFLQTSTIVPVGASRPRKVNVRIVCATNRDPMEAVRAGLFREDLFYRLHVIPIAMPPLRARGNDVLALADAALRRFALEEGRRFAAFDDEVRAIFLAHPWPGNVRQLLNAIRNIVVLNDGLVVTRSMLPAELAGGTGAPALPAAPGPEAQGTGDDDDRACLDRLLREPLAVIERRLIERALQLHGQSVPRAARALGVAPSTLYRKIEAWNSGQD